MPEVSAVSRSVLKHTNLENGQVPLRVLTPPTANEFFFFLKLARFYLTLAVTLILVMTAVKLFCATVTEILFNSTSCRSFSPFPRKVQFTSPSMLTFPTVITWNSSTRSGRKLGPRTTA